MRPWRRAFYRGGVTTFVLVPGMNHGGWWYEPLATALRDGPGRVLELLLGLT